MYRSSGTCKPTESSRSSRRLPLLAHLEDLIRGDVCQGLSRARHPGNLQLIDLFRVPEPEVHARIARAAITSAAEQHAEQLSLAEIGRAFRADRRSAALSIHQTQ